MGRAVSTSALPALSLSSYTRAPTTWLPPASGPRSSACLGSVSAAAGDERLPASRSAPVPPGSRRPHGEWTAFISCIGLAQLTAASGGPPREMPAAGFAAKGSVQCHVREFRLPGAPGG